MRLAYPSLALALALGAPSAARAAPPGPSARGPTAHKSSGHHATPTPAHADHHNGQGHHDGHAGHTDQHKAGQPQTGQHHPDHPHHHHHDAAHHDKGGHAGGGQKGASSFQGMVVRAQVNADGKCGRVWARDGRGQVQMFHVSNSTQLSG